MESNTKVTVSALAIASLALVCLAVGCARHEDSTTSAVASSGQEVVAASTAGAVSVPAETPAAFPTGEDPVAVAGDSLPPEVTASVADLPILPGGIVEITAVGSADVVAVTLADGIGKPQAFAFDSTARLWRASYRVPLQMPERLGLAITARNDVARWRRVWVFLSPAGVETGPVVSEK